MSSRSSLIIMLWFEKFHVLTYVLCFKVIHIHHQQHRSLPAYASSPQASWSRLLDCFTPLLLNQFQFLPFPLFVALGNCPFKIGNDCRELLKCAVRLLALRFMIFPTFTPILADPNCPPNSELCLLSSGRRCTRLQCRTNRLKNSFVPAATEFSYMLFTVVFLHCWYWVLVCFCTSAVAQHFSPCGIIKIPSWDIITWKYLHFNTMSFPL